MCAHDRTIWLKRIALLILLSVFCGAEVFAQTPSTPNRSLEMVLTSGMTVWITDSSGREEKTRILEVSGDVVTTAAGEDIRRRRTTDIMRIQSRQSDSVLNGALIGAGAGVAAGLLLCTAMEPLEVCRNDVGSMVKLGALGAGIGIGVDALIRGRKTIYERPGVTRVFATPVVGPKAAGLQVQN